MPMPPAMKTIGADASAGRMNFPAGPKTLMGEPSGISARLRLSALPVMRVAKTRRLASWGDDAIENVRLAPFSSV